MSDELMTAAEAAIYLKTTYKGFDHWTRRHGVACTERRGRIRLYRKGYLDRVVRTMALRPVSASLRKASGF
jgi:hypothetical protein